MGSLHPLCLHPPGQDVEGEREPVLSKLVNPKLWLHCIYSPVMRAFLLTSGCVPGLVVGVLF
jgi:hypothetical protein